MHQADKLKMGETILFLPLFIDVIISGVLYLEVCFLFTWKYPLIHCVVVFLAVYNDSPERH